MKDRWERLEGWLKEEDAKELLENLNPPATASEIDHVESEIGLQFPPSARQSYRVHNGMSGSFAHSLFHTWRPFPLEKVVDKAESMEGIGEQFGDDCWDPTTAIPIMANGTGDLLYVEHAPGGEETPVVSWNHETHVNDQLAPSYVAFFDMLLDAIDAGKFEYEAGRHCPTYTGSESPFSIW